MSFAHPSAPAGDVVGRSTYVWAFVAVVGLLALVAFASAGNPVSIPLRAGRADRLELFKMVSAIAAVGVLAGLAFTIVLHRTVIARRGGMVSLRHTLVRALPITAVAIAIVALMTIARVQLHTGEIRDVVTVITGAEGRPPMPCCITDHRSPPVIAGEGQVKAADTLFIEAQALTPERSPYGRIVLTIIAVALLLAMLVNRWRSRSARRSELRRHEDASTSEDVAVHGAVVNTIDAMLCDPDPNTTIIGAYARLTENLAACGSGRLEHEGPMEHLRRVLSRVNVQPEPLRLLIHLFELARFSSYRLTSSHREQALGALHAVAADIAMSPPQDTPSAHAAAVR